MKILYVNDYSAPIGGAETMLLALRDGMRTRGHDARLFASSARPQNMSGFADFECFGTLGRWRTALQSYNVDAKRELKRVLNNFQPDVVHVKMFLTQLSPSILPLLKDVPTLYHAVWYRAICPLGTKMLPNLSPCTYSVGVACCEQGCLKLHDWVVLMGQMKLWRQWAGVFDRVVPISAAVKKALIAAGINCDEPVSNGVAARPMRQSMDDTPTVAFAGRLVKEKGVDLLLAAMAIVLRQIPQARLLIAGNGPERAALQQQVAELGISGSVQFVGHLLQQEMEERFDKAWTQVVCSRWAEPFGMTAVEAMMRGVAVIASNTGGLGEIIEHQQSGLLVPPGDVSSLSNAILELLIDRSRAMTLGRAGRERALLKFDLEQCLDQFERIYCEMVNLRGPKAEACPEDRLGSEFPEAGKR